MTEPDCGSTARQMLVYAVVLLFFSVVPTAVGMTGRFYAAAAVLMGAWLLHANVRAAAKKTALCARGVLMATVIYLPVLYVTMLLDRSW